MGQLVSKIHYLALDRDAIGVLTLSTAGSVLLILYYLYREKRIQKIVHYLYQKAKIWPFGVPQIILLPILVWFVYLLSLSSFVIRFAITFVLFCVFSLYSAQTFYRITTDQGYRERNGYRLYEGIVVEVRKQESEAICFRLRYCSENGNEGVISTNEQEFVYNNQVSYPIFGLSFSQVEEEMKLKVVTKNSDSGDEILPLEAWIITPSEDCFHGSSIE